MRPHIRLIDPTSIVLSNVVGHNRLTIVPVFSAAASIVATVEL